MSHPTVNVTQTVNQGGPYVKRWEPGIAMLLSFLIPGAGQLYKGQALAGIVWFFAVCFGYLILIIPGLLLHLGCIVEAGMGDPHR